MRILITGSSGLIGSSLIPFLNDQGNEIVRLVRDKKIIDNTSIYWNPALKALDADAIENFQVVIHLAGENIASRRWTKKQKVKIYNSRIKSTRLLVEKLKNLKKPPELLICASATGYYGDRGEELLTETSSKGKGFLADLVWEWEKNASIAKDNGIRVVSLRMGVVLSGDGGALKKILLPFKMGLGTIVGNGQQYMPWISIDDVNTIIDFIIRNESISGAVNVVAPKPITNYEYSESLGKALSRPVFFKVPASILKLAFGEMAEQLVLSSSKVLPKVLTDHGFSFLHENIDQSLSALLEHR
jgi:uncharacterized protein (TIGR01777 family)